MGLSSLTLRAKKNLTSLKKTVRFIKKPCRVGNVFLLPTNMILMVNGMVGKQKTRLPTLPDFKGKKKPDKFKKTCQVYQEAM